MNDRIRAGDVRLIDKDGEQLGIKPLEEALKISAESRQDLVEVAPNATPPVCRIMDYGKFKYKQQKRTHDPGKKHHVSQLKELRLRPKTDKHDIEIRIRRARQFLERGDRVLVNMLFRGREMAHADIGKGILERFAADLEDMAKVEKYPTMVNRRMSIILVHKHHGTQAGKGPAKAPAKQTPPKSE